MPRWVVVWLVITAIIQTYDACYVLLGPLSHAGGPLAGLWPGHVFYGPFDHRYAQFDAFGSAQSWANRTEERRVGKACGRTGRTRRSPYHEKKKKKHENKK